MFSISNTFFTLFLNLVISINSIRSEGGVGLSHLPVCAHECLEKLSFQSACGAVTSLSCICKDQVFLTAINSCFHKECSYNSLTTASKLVTTCSDSYGVKPIVDSAPAVKPTPVTVYVPAPSATPAPTPNVHGLKPNISAPPVNRTETIKNTTLGTAPPASSETPLFDTPISTNTSESQARDNVNTGGSSLSSIDNVIKLLSVLAIVISLV